MILDGISVAYKKLRTIVALHSGLEYKDEIQLERLRREGEDKPGYWELRGYHIHGDPWKKREGILGRGYEGMGDKKGSSTTDSI